MEKLAQVFLSLILAGCLLGGIGLFATAGGENDGSYAIAGAIMIYTFVHTMTNMTKEA